MQSHLPVYICYATTTKINISIRYKQQSNTTGNSSDVQITSSLKQMHNIYFA